MNESLAPTRPLCILHSDDAELRHRLAAILHERTYVCHAPDQMRLEELLGGSEPMLLFIDLSVEGGLELLPRLGRSASAGGRRWRSDTRTAIHSRWRRMRAFTRWKTSSADRRTPARPRRTCSSNGSAGCQETHMLRDELARLRAMQPARRRQRVAPTARGRGAIRSACAISSRPRSTSTGLEELFDRIVEGVASAAMVNRVGLFYRYENDGFFTVSRPAAAVWRTPWRWSSATATRWCAGLQRNPRLITRASLDHIADPTERTLLASGRSTLLGAETFIPLNLRGRVLGWLFTGADGRACRSTTTITRNFRS